jgi:hypothetical protein
MVRRRRARYIQETGTEVRLRTLVSVLDAAEESSFTVKELAEASGLREQQTAVALATLRVIRLVVREYDSMRRRHVWRVGSPPASEKGDQAAAATFYSVPEAAEETGRSEKALWSRIQRKTLPVVHEGKRVLVPRSALQAAGLVDDRWRRTHTAAGIEAMIDVLRLERGRPLSTWQLTGASRLHRQTCELALLTLVVAGLVERKPAGGVVWAWKEWD